MYSYTYRKQLKFIKGELKLKLYLEDILHGLKYIHSEGIS